MCRLSDGRVAAGLVSPKGSGAVRDHQRGHGRPTRTALESVEESDAVGCDIAA